MSLIFLAIATRELSPPPALRIDAFAQIDCTDTRWGKTDRVANTYTKHWATNPALMAASLGAGARLIWLMNKASWGLVTAQVRLSPHLASTLDDLECFRLRCGSQVLTEGGAESDGATVMLSPPLCDADRTGPCNGNTLDAHHRPITFEPRSAVPIARRRMDVVLGLDAAAKMSRRSMHSFYRLYPQSVTRASSEEEGAVKGAPAATSRLISSAGGISRLLLTRPAQVPSVWS